MSRDGAPSAVKRLRLRAETLEWREVDGEIVALDGVSSNYLSANSSGALLWQELAPARGATREELVAALVAAYDIDAGQAAADVDSFVAVLDANGLLEPA